MVNEKNVGESNIRALTCNKEQFTFLPFQNSHTHCWLSRTDHTLTHSIHSFIPMMEIGINDGGDDDGIHILTYTIQIIYIHSNLTLYQVCVYSHTIMLFNCQYSNNITILHRIVAKL